MAGPIFDGKALISVGELPGLRLVNSGKVRDVYEVDAEYLLMVSTDRISAFDVIMKNGVPGKGKVLNQLTVFWLTHFASEGLTEHHLVTADVGQMPEVCITNMPVDLGDDARIGAHATEGSEEV